MSNLTNNESSLTSPNQHQNQNQQEQELHNSELFPIIRKRTPKSQRQRNGLIQFAKDYTSQNGEDGIIAKIFEILPRPSRRRRQITTTTTNSTNSSWCCSCDNHNNNSMKNSNSNSLDSKSHQGNNHENGVDNENHHQQLKQQDENDECCNCNCHDYYCVDVGAWDGHHLSNTYSLLVQQPQPQQQPQQQQQSLAEQGTNDTDNHTQQEKQPPQEENPKEYKSQPPPATTTTTTTATTTWHGVLIEADSERFQQLKQLHEPLGNICINKIVSCHKGSKDNNNNNDNSNNNPNSLVSLLKEYASSSSSSKFHLPFDFDFLSIDVDGPDYWLLYEMLKEGTHNNDNNNNDNTSKYSSSHYYRPKVICIEANPTMPNDLIYIPPRNDFIRHGASLAALVELAEQCGYVLIETTIYNAFFVLREFYEPYFQPTWVPDTSIEALHEITMGTSLYQLYDGTIKLWGCKKLLWHRQTIEEDQIQVLKKVEQRNFPFFNPSNTNTKRKEQDDLSSFGTIIDISPYCSNSSNNNNNNNNNDHGNNITINDHQEKKGNNKDDIEKQKQKQNCAKALIQQLQQKGFALVNGTQNLISTQLCQEALQATKSFLQDADESVRRSCLTKDRARRGYSPMCTENFASLLGEEGPNDLVRKFRIGPPSSCISKSKSSVASTTITITNDGTTSLDDNNDNNISNNDDNNNNNNSNNKNNNNDDDKDDNNTSNNNNNNSPLLRPNIWPNPNNNNNNNVWDEQSCHSFQSTIEAYYEAICSVANAIVCAICDGVMEENPKLASSKKTSLCKLAIHNDSLARTSILTLLGYQKGARHKKAHHKKKRHVHPLVAAHTDVGIITVLLFDAGDCAVLQREAIEFKNNNSNNNNNNNSNDKSWADVHLPDIYNNNNNHGPTFVVNIADCLSELTHRYLPSTIHRVMPTSSGDIPRNCLALFVGLDPNEKIIIKKNGNGDGDTNDKQDDDDDDEDDDELEEITYEEWRKRRIMKSQAVLSKGA